MLKPLKMKVKTKFDDWFYQLEDEFALRSERFFNECDHYLKCEDKDQKEEGEKIFVSWLRAAFEAGMASNN